MLMDYEIVALETKHVLTALLADVVRLLLFQGFGAVVAKEPVVLEI